MYFLDRRRLSFSFEEKYGVVLLYQSSFFYIYTHPLCLEHCSKNIISAMHFSTLLPSLISSCAWCVRILAACHPIIRFQEIQYLLSIVIKKFGIRGIRKTSSTISQIILLISRLVDLFLQLKNSSQKTKVASMTTQTR